jgi:serine/threonine-protein kinase
MYAPKIAVSTDTFGKYRLVAEIGSGGMADVSLAMIEGPTGLGFSKLLVIKRLRPNLMEDEEFVAMLVDEARLAARLNHPNVVQTVEVGDVDGRYYIAMEHLEGQPLQRIQQRAARGTALPARMQYRVLYDVLGGLHHAHQLTDYDGTPLEVVHRDVSPHNVFVTYDGVAKVVDFGIAKVDGRRVETRTGVVKGKLTYMAPEQALAAAVDRRADVFSAGVILWEIATGQRMWKGLQDTDILRCLIAGKVPTSPRSVAPDVDEELDRICQRALAVGPDDRYPTALAFQKDLQTYLVASGQEATTRDVAKTVTQMFAAERLRMRQRIEAKLAEISSGEVSSALPVLNEPLSGSNPNLAMVNSQKAASLEPGSNRPADASRPPAARSKGKRRPAGSRMMSWLVIAALLTGFLLVDSPWRARLLEWRGALAPVSQVARLPVNAIRRPRALRLTLRAAPPEAAFFIDDGPKLDNPYVGVVAADGLEHKIRVVAVGHVERTRIVPFVEDIDVEVALEREDEAAAPERAQPARRPARAAEKPPPAPKPRAAATERAKRSIDTTSPWQ